MRNTIVRSQEMRECRWSQPACPPYEDSEENLLEAPWACGRRTGEERLISEAECAGCKHWVRDETFARRNLTFTT